MTLGKSETTFFWNIAHVQPGNPESPGTDPITQSSLSAVLSVDPGEAFPHLSSISFQTTSQTANVRIRSQLWEQIR